MDPLHLLVDVSVYKIRLKSRPPGSHNFVKTKTLHVLRTNWKESVDLKEKVVVIVTHNQKLCLPEKRVTMLRKLRSWLF